LAFVERKINEMIQTMKLAKKTSKDDYFTHLRLVLLGLAAVGGIAFMIKLIAEFVTFGSKH
jgi:protein transport protein SEC61 subunit gamma and related proteins